MCEVKIGWAGLYASDVQARFTEVYFTVAPAALGFQHHAVFLPYDNILMC